MQKVSLAACICSGQFWLRKQQVFWFRAEQYGLFLFASVAFPLLTEESLYLSVNT